MGSAVKERDLKGPAHDAVEARYRHRLSPLTVGSVMVRNRAFASVHGTGSRKVGGLADRHVEYRRARAHGGIGLVVIEAPAVDDSPLGAGRRGGTLKRTDQSIAPPIVGWPRRCVPRARGCEGAKAAQEL
ncbi:MAG: hypothetical protein IT555_17480 [Acetobacteraceae bacterium]|nr:hypothetical protein [Acetobacteraceae bacterium]